MFKWIQSKLSGNKPQKFANGDFVGEYILSQSGVQVTPRTAINFTTCYACVRAISETTASLPFNVYEKLPKGGKQKLEDNPVWRCLNISPDGIMDAFAWREACSAHLLQWGNCYNEIETFKNGDIDLHLIPPSVVEPQRMPDGSVSYKLQGQQTLIPSNRMLHFMMLGNGLEGFSPVRIGKDAIGLAKSMESFGSKFFANGCSATGLLTHPHELKPAAMDNLRNSIHAHHAGDNAHKLLILQEGMTYTPLSVPPEDAQFLASRLFQVQEICRLFRVDPAVIGEHSNSTFTNVEQQMLNFVVHCIRPHCRRMESEINRKLFLNDSTYFAEHLIDGLLRGDTPARFNAYNIGKMAGFLCTNEIREMENLNPVEGGNVFLQPLNMVIAGTDSDDGSEADDGNDDPSGDGQSPPLGTVPPVSIDTTPLSPDDISVSSLDVVKDAVDRMIRREVEAIKSAANKPDSFLNMVDLFYQKQISICERAIKPSLDLYCKIARKNVKNFAETIVDEGRTSVITIYQTASNDDLGALINQWAETRLNYSKEMKI